MIKKFTLLTATLFVLSYANAQTGNVGIGTAAPDASSVLDITSTDKGLLIPRVALTATNAAGPITLPASSLLVYNTATAGTAPNNVTPGYYYNAGSTGSPNWKRLTVKANNGLSLNSDDNVQLGGALIQPTIISGLTATNTISFTGTGQNAFSVDGSTFSVDVSNNRVGIGTTAPDNTLTVNNAGTTGSNTSSYPLGIQRAGSTDLTLGSDANYAFFQSWNSKPLLINAQGNNVGIGTSSAPKERLHIDGNVLSNKNYIATQGIVTGKIERIVGPGTGADNQWHTVELSNGYGGTTISAYATGSYLDGEIKIQGVDISDLLDNSTIGWYTTDAGNTWKSVSTTKDASSGLTGDSRGYQVYCPNDYIATGWQVYANSQLDHYLKLRCTKLKSAYGTVEITEGIESVLSSPRNTGDNITHFSACPAGTFIKGLSIYANTYLDGNLTVGCTGIKLK